MDAIHNAVDKTKDFLHGESHVTNKDVAKAAQHEEKLHHEAVKEDIKHDKKIAKAAEKVEKEAHKHNVKELEANKDLSKAADKLQHEQHKKCEKDMKADAKLNEAAGHVAHLQGKQMEQNLHHHGHNAVVTETTGPHGVTKTTTTEYHN